MLWPFSTVIGAAARVASHYAASSSSPALAAAYGSLPRVPAQAYSLWRSVHHSSVALDAAPHVPAGAAQAPAPQPAAPAPAAVELDLDVLSDATNFPSAPEASTSGQLSLPPHVLRDLRPPKQPYQLLPKQAQRPIDTPALYTPWTPTRALQRRKHISKRMGFLVQVLEREQVERIKSSRPLPDFRAGDILELRLMVPEAERKVAVYRGVCIARYNKGLRSSFKIYNVFPDCGGVVQHLPLYMPDLLGLRVVGRVPAKQERLFYLLERQGTEYTYQTNVTAAT